MHTRMITQLVWLGVLFFPLHWVAPRFLCNSLAGKKLKEKVARQIVIQVAVNPDAVVVSGAGPRVVVGEKIDRHIAENVFLVEHFPDGLGDAAQVNRRWQRGLREHARGVCEGPALYFLVRSDQFHLSWGLDEKAESWRVDLILGDIFRKLFDDAALLVESLHIVVKGLVEAAGHDLQLVRQVKHEQPLDWADSFQIFDRGGGRAFLVRKDFTDLLDAGRPKVGDASSLELVVDFEYPNPYFRVLGNEYRQRVIQLFLVIDFFVELQSRDSRALKYGKRVRLEGIHEALVRVPAQNGHVEVHGHLHILVWGEPCDQVGIPALN